MYGEIFDRTKKLIGEEALDILQSARVLVFGLGGVGSYVCEALARAGVGCLGIVDRDFVALSNINRQLIALHSTVGRKKTEVTAERLADINPDLKLRQYFISYDKDTGKEIDFGEYDYVVDAIDSLPSKVLIAKKAKEVGVPLIASMGTGFRMDPSRFRIIDIFSTSGCPLSRLMRKQLKAAGIDSLKVLFSDEPSLAANKDTKQKTQDAKLLSGTLDGEKEKLCLDGLDSGTARSVQKTIASISFVPSVAGLMIAGEVVRDIIAKCEAKREH